MEPPLPTMVHQWHLGFLIFTHNYASRKDDLRVLGNLRTSKIGMF